MLRGGAGLPDRLARGRGRRAGSSSCAARRASGATGDVFDQEAVERFDDVLNAATDQLIDTLERVSRDNMRAEIDRFVEALEHDHILPFDF